MLLRDSHPSDQELLMAADGELGGRRVRRVAAHLNRCWECRARAREMEAAIAEFVRVHRDSNPATAAAGPRALLKARLREVAPAERPVNGRLLPGPVFLRAGLAAAIVVLAAGILDVAFHPPARETHLLPVAKITPGVALQLSRRDVCVAAPPKNRTVPAVLRTRVFQAYGMSGADPSRYEVDYLITPALGGADDIRNLWPQPYSARIWNAAAKDQLEDRLHEMVCEGKIDLVTAQREISGNWIAAYRKYVGPQDR